MGIDLHFSSVFARRDSQFHLDIEMSTQAKRIGILGASGCGKSATLKAIAGLLAPQQGRIVIDDDVLFDSDKRINIKPAQRRCGLLFQNYQLFTNMTVEQNIATGLIHQKMVNRWGRIISHQAHELIDQYLDLLHIRDLAHQPVYHLSGGQQQRVALARMLASDPRIIMLDEPFSALDAHLKTELYPQLDRLLHAVDKTLLYVTHDIDEVCRFCDWLVVIDHGHIVEMGDRQQILHHPQSLAALKLGGTHAILPVEYLSASQVKIQGLNQVLCVETLVDTGVSAVGIAQRDIQIIMPCDGHKDRVCASNILTARIVCITSARHRLLVSCQLTREGDPAELLPLITVSLARDSLTQENLQALVPDADVLLYMDPASLIPVR